MLFQLELNQKFGMHKLNVRNRKLVEVSIFPSSAFGQRSEIDGTGYVNGNLQSPLKTVIEGRSTNAIKKQE